MATEYDGAKRVDAQRYPWEEFSRVKIDAARSCRWTGAQEDPAVWRKFLESLVVSGQIQPCVMAKVPPNKEIHLLVGSRRFLGIKEINENLPEWQAWIESKIEEIANRLVADTTLSEALADELHSLKRVYEDARKRIEVPMSLIFMSRQVRSREEADRIALEENDNRLDMSPMDRANFAYTKKQRGETNREIAVAMKLKSATAVKNLLEYISLIPEAQELLHQGHLTEALAGRMRRLPAERQLEFCLAAKEGKKPSELLRQANSESRLGGEQVLRSAAELRQKLAEIRSKDGDLIVKTIAAWLLEWVNGNPDAPDLETIFAADTLPEPPKPPEPKPPKSPGVPKPPKVQKPKKEKKAKKATSGKRGRPPGSKNKKPAQAALPLPMDPDADAQEEYADDVPAIERAEDIEVLEAEDDTRMISARGLLDPDAGYADPFEDRSIMEAFGDSAVAREWQC